MPIAGVYHLKTKCFPKSVQVERVPFGMPGKGDNSVVKGIFHLKDTFKPLSYKELMRGRCKTSH